jgi:hypothetical protein
VRPNATEKAAGNRNVNNTKRIDNTKRITTAKKTEDTKKTVKTKDTDKTTQTDKTKETDKTKKAGEPEKTDDAKKIDKSKKEDHTVKPASRTTENRQLKDGTKAQVSRRSDGRVVDIQTKAMTIHQGVHGDRTIVTKLNGHTIVSTGTHSGYMQHPLSGYRNTYFRTTWRGGRPHAGFYRGYDGYYYRGVYHPMHYYRYVPVYRPAFYRWAYNPWGMRVYYSPVAWGWAGAPWFGLYGGFFTSYPVYDTASLWLTDYLLAANLQAAYQAGLAAHAAASDNGGPPSGDSTASTDTPLNSVVKQAIADEVQQQLAAQQAAAANSESEPSSAAAPEANPAEPTSGPVPDALDPAQSLFVVSSNLDVATADGQECELTSGDVIDRIDDAPGTDNKVQVKVISSKKNDCRVGAKPMVAVDDLQEMHNSFREQLDAGLQALQEKSGTDGLPKAPNTAVTGAAPKPDPGAANEIQSQQQKANSLVAQVQ